MAKIKRSLIKTFLNTATPGSPTWVLVGPGIVSGSIEYNPKITTETYISDDNATTLVDGYAPTFPIEMVADNGDALFEYLDTLRRNRDILTDVETEIVNVWLYESPAGSYYHAEKQNVAIQIDTFGGDGGVSTKIGYTVNFIGDPTIGIFKPTATAAFEALPVTTVLTTMVIGAVTLSPLFATDKSNLLYTGSVANGTTTVAMTSTLVGATIVQKEGSNVVNQGANASLGVGINHLTIEVTVGAEVSTYRIDITRAAA